MNITILSRKMAELLIAKGLPDHAAVISFHDPGREPPTYPQTTGASLILHIPLDDFQTELPEASQIAQLIYAAKNGGLNLVCQCESGQSRSAGCAAAILEHLYRTGKLIFDDDRYHPDEMVYYKVLDALAAILPSWGADQTARGNIVCPAVNREMPNPQPTNTPRKAKAG